MNFFFFFIVPFYLQTTLYFGTSPGQQLKNPASGTPAAFS
jgi:hypothetical protein